MNRLYLDWNATAPLRPEAKAAMAAAMEVVGNPSSVHAEGRAAKAMIERSRAQVAAAVGCVPDEVIFTSGATEAAMVLSQVRGHGAVMVDPTAHDALWAHFDLTGAETGNNVLAMGLANGETGVITEPPKPVGGRWSYGTWTAGSLLLDVTQAIGRIPFSFAWSGADMAILSSHKFGGPKGAGALIVRSGLDISALSLGGGQEMGRRAGTENLIGIAGMGAAAEAAARDLANGVWDEVAEVRNILESELSATAKETISVGNGLPHVLNRLPNTLCLIAPGWKGETQVMAMDLAGFAVSAGSACSSGKVRPSRVLTAMGFDDALAAQAIRVSIGPGVVKDDVLRFAQCWTAAYAKARARAA